MTDPGVPATLQALSPAARRALTEVVELLASDPAAPTTVTDRDRAWREHVADSLSGLEFEELASARRVGDVGAGAGFPGIAIAAARPESSIDLIESTRRKCRFAERAIERARIENSRVICERAESWALGDGREAYDAVTIRALGSLATVAELASPLLRDGAFLLAWRGRREPRDEERLQRAGPRLAMETAEVRPVTPFSGSRNRHIHLLRKNGPTPPGLPRRPGMAAKRPFGSE